MRLDIGKYIKQATSTTVTVTNNQFTMPAYPVTVSAVMANDLKVWCAPNVTVSGDIHLTSYKDLFVQSSSTAGNALNVTSTDWGSATEMEIAYLGAGDTEVAKGDSHFRLYSDNTNTAVDASSSSVDISASRTFNTDYSIRYTPSAYNTTNTYKLQLTFQERRVYLKDGNS